MAEQSPPAWLEAGTYTAPLDRVALHTPFNGRIPSSYSNFPGAVGGPVGNWSSLQVTASGATSQVVVTEGSAIISGPAVAGVVPAYSVRNEGNKTLTIGGAPGAGLYRYDVVYAEVRNAAYGGASNDWRITYVSGSASASNPPPIPLPSSVGATHWIPLAMVKRSGTTTAVNSADVTDVRLFTSTNALHHWNSAVASTTPTITQSGSLRYDNNPVLEGGGRLAQYRGSAWDNLLYITDLTVGGRQPISPTITSFSNSLHNHVGDSGGGEIRYVGARVYRSGDQVIPDSTWEDVSFDSTNWDAYAMHDPGSNPQQIEAPYPGYYIVHARVRFAGDADGRRAVQIRKNDTSGNATAGSEQSYSQAASTGASVATYLETTALVELGAGEFIKVFVWHNAGANLNIVGPDNVCWLSYQGKS